MNILILTGAGISAESGLGTFRDSDGIWTRFDLEEVATPEGFERDPAKVHDFYNARRRNVLAAKPNDAHLALARLEQSRKHNVTIVTQNIDDLHERAGSRNILHMHGEILRALCHNCGVKWDAPGEMSPYDRCPDCNTAYTRPDVVWFGEIPYHLDEIRDLLDETDLFVAIGTSGEVHPASSFVQLAAMAGASTLELNLDPSETTIFFTESRRGPATQIVPAWVNEVIGSTAS